jgi:hypothetical protein
MPSCTFDEAIELRLRTSKTEATREVLALVKDMYLGDAVALVIESMPRQKTAQLRRWNDSWEGWCEWVEWVERGWEIRQVNSGIASLLPPLGSSPEGPKERPSVDAVAAAIDATTAKFLGVSHSGGSARRPRIQFLYKVH